MARYPYYRPGLPTCYHDDTYVVKTKEELDALKAEIARICDEILLAHIARGDIPKWLEGAIPSEGT